MTAKGKLGKGCLYWLTSLLASPFYGHVSEPAHLLCCQQSESPQPMPEGAWQLIAIASANVPGQADKTIK